jgi:hypothetical protein
MEEIIAFCVRENKSETIADCMTREYNSDVEHWSNCSLWSLFDYVCETKGVCYG